MSRTRGAARPPDHSPLEQNDHSAGRQRALANFTRQKCGFRLRSTPKQRRKYRFAVAGLCCSRLKPLLQGVESGAGFAAEAAPTQGRTAQSLGHPGTSASRRRRPQTADAVFAAGIALTLVPLPAEMPSLASNLTSISKGAIPMQTKTASCTPDRQDTKSDCAAAEVGRSIRGRAGSAEVGPRQAARSTEVRL
jgi:hypothetical protein